MTVTTRRPDDGILPLLALLGAVGLGAMVWWPIMLVGSLNGAHLPGNPAALFIGLATGKVHLAAMSAVLVLIGLQVLAAITIGVLVLSKRSKTRTSRSRVDGSSQHLARTNQLTGLTPAQAARNAQRLRAGATLVDANDHGILIGETVAGRIPLRMGFEDVAVIIAGPRVGKTTSVVVPAVVGYRGPVKTSSNKPDVHDATRAIREQLGRCWLCDPQQLVDTPSLRGEPAAAWWWNPLADVTTMSTARELVQVLIDTSTSADARPDAYFHPTGRTVLINYVFAAAIGGHTLHDVADWLRNTDDRTAVRTLTDRGYAVAGNEILAVLSKPDKQRDGVLGTAQSWLSVLADPNYAAWITPPAHSGVAEFRPEVFVRSAGDTIYLLSQEGPASAAFITTAINAAINRAAEAFAADQPQRRLANPVLSVLDEAANTVRDTTLPDKFSHYGSKGLPHIVILQSWSQGEEVWDKRGMNKLWSAANIKLYAGGVSETDFLRTVSDLLGQRDERYWLASSSRSARGGSRSAGEQIRRVPVMDVATLAALPRGRAVLFSSGNEPALIRPVPWMATADAPRIEASLAAYEPSGRRLERLAASQRFAADVAAADTPRATGSTANLFTTDEGALL